MRLEADRRKGPLEMGAVCQVLDDRLVAILPALGLMSLLLD